MLAATLRLARDVDIAEEATADAFVLALQTWPERGVPDSVEAWLLTTARRRAIDKIRRAATLRDRLGLLATMDETTTAGADAVDRRVRPCSDDDLRLVVLCCHPALAVETQVALTMRLGCGVPTASIAAAFLVPEPTMAARLTRAKRRVAESGVGIDLPDDLAVEERMPAVRRTIHLAYTMGHTAGSGGDAAPRRAGRARRAAGPALHDLRPDDTEATGLLALILLTEARAGARFDETGDQVLLADADRTRWDRERLAEGLALVAALPRRPGPLALQAAIAAEHADGAVVRGDRLARHRRPLRRPAVDRAEPDDRPRSVPGRVPRRRSGRRAGRPRRGDRGRRARALPVRPGGARRSARSGWAASTRRPTSGRPRRRSAARRRSGRTSTGAVRRRARRRPRCCRRSGGSRG